MPKDLPGDFPRGPVIKNLPSNVGDMGLIPGQTTRILQATTREACMPQQRPSKAKKKKACLMEGGHKPSVCKMCSVC